ncbi:MAG TPA: bifunctional riboflavin kinase/FAD synthetase [Flavitalea sp.]|nr:bifunctional riboflavin kinase/FAD synthetase [Flavitalea sp.]
MLVHRDIDKLPSFIKPVLTIGTFDGVHIGHRQILQQMKTTAGEMDGETVIITFHPHPRTVVDASAEPIPLITTIEERIELLSSMIDHLVVVKFTEHFSKMPAREYVENFLLAKFHPDTLIIGYDHRFGTERIGDYKLLEEYQRKGSFRLIEIPPHVLNENTVSSTRIRDAIRSGRIEEANDLLGYEFFFTAVVTEGNKLGRTIGFPTANLMMPIESKLIPGDGVYAVHIEIENNPQGYDGMMNIGMRPTIGGTKRLIEVNIFNFQKDIYGRSLRVAVHHRLRDEKKFSGIEELKIQLQRDKEAAISILAK